MNPNHKLGDIIVQRDSSGVGHCWRNEDEDSMPVDIVEEIVCEACEIGYVEDWQEYIASNGCKYRWM